MEKVKIVYSNRRKLYENIRIVCMSHVSDYGCGFFEVPCWIVFNGNKFNGVNQGKKFTFILK